ncbi:MAG: hypothetical protein WDN29_16565 [Methylovirgula sp.]
MRKMVAAWAVLALAGEIFCLSQVPAWAENSACRGLVDAMVKNSKTPYHSVGTISFDPKDPPAPGTTISPKPISTESIFTGTQVFAKTPNGQWKDIHAVISDLQQRVADSVESFTDCRRAPDEMIDGKRFVVYIGSQDSGALNIATKIWVSVETGTLALSDIMITAPTPPDGKIRHQLMSLRYDYAGIKPPASSN